VRSAASLLLLPQKAQEAAEGPALVATRHEPSDPAEQLCAVILHFPLRSYFYL